MKSMNIKKHLVLFKKKLILFMVFVMVVSVLGTIPSVKAVANMQNSMTECTLAKTNVTQELKAEQEIGETQIEQEEEIENGIISKDTKEDEDTEDISEYINKKIEERIIPKNPNIPKEATDKWSGDYVYYGLWNKKNIKWRVLQNDGEYLLLMTDSGIESIPYRDVNSYAGSYSDKTDNIYANSTIRDWMNNTFLTEAFSSEEQNEILVSNVENGFSSTSKYDSGPNTEDKVYALSFKEFFNTSYGFWGESENSASRVFLYETAYGDLSTEYVWTRTMYEIAQYAGSPFAVWVNENGGFSSRGSWYTHPTSWSKYVHPVIKIPLASQNWKNYIDDGSAEDETNPTPEKPSGVSAFDQNIVNNIDVSEYTQGVNLGKDAIHGPTLNIMGKEIELFSIDANVKLEIADEVTYKINAKNKTIEVLVGVESRDGKVDFSDDANSDSEWTKTYSQVESLYQGITKGKSTKNLYNQFRSLRSKLHSTNSTLLISGDVKSVLFLKFSYETGKIELMEGGGIVSAELGADWEKPIPQFPLAYVTVGAKASGELTFKVVPAWSGELGIDLALNAGAGIGEKKHAKTYIEGGTKVTLKNKLKLPAKSIAESLSVKVNGKAYLKAKVFGMVVGEISKDYVNLNLYPEFGIEKNALFLSQANLEKQLSPESVEYVTSAATVETGREVDFEKKDLYPYCAPILTDLGNNCYLLVWVDDIGDKDAYNRTTLMYSYYNGSQWISPQKVAESDYLNDYPAVYGKDGVAYVVWQQATEKCDENTTVEEMLTCSDLYCAKFANESFGTPFAITDNNEVYEMQQQVCITGDKVYVAWVENSENDPFMGKDEINTIYMKEITNESSEKVVVSDNLETVSNVVIGEVDNRFIVAYEDGTNGYLYDGDSIQSLSDDGDKLMNLQIKDGLLYALVNDYVSEYRDGSFVSLELPLAGDYTVLSDGAHIVSNVSDGDTSKLVLYTKYDNGWNDGVALTDGTKYVRNYQIIEKENGELTSVVCEVEINLETEDIYGKADLYVDNLEAENDLELLDTVYTDKENPIAGENLTLYYEVANKGANQVDEFTISLATEDGTVLQEEPVNIQIQSGTTAKENITVTMPDNMEKQDYILSIQSDNDQVEDNNQITVTLGYSDLSIKECTMDEDGTITGLLLNEGYETAENVRVKVYKDSMDTEPVKEISYDSLTAGQQQELLVSLSQEDLVAIDGALGTTWILDVETDSVEAGYGNNTDTVFCYRPLELSLTDSIAVPVGKTAQLKMTDNLTRDNFSDKVLWSSSDKNIVVVSNKGVIKGVKKGNAEVYAWFEDEMYTCHVIVNDTSKSEGIKQEESKTETAQPEKPQSSQNQTLPTVGTQITSSSAVYKVTKSSSSRKEVTYVKPKSKNKTSVTIPNTIKISGFTYKVTSVTANALSGNKKVTRVTVGKNVTSIGKNAFKNCKKLKTVTLKSTSLKSIGSNAFYGDKNLKTITIKSSKLTSKSVGKNAFKGTNKKLTIKVPKKKVSFYKKFLGKKGNKYIKVKK